VAVAFVATTREAAFFFTRQWRQAGNAVDTDKNRKKSAMLKGVPIMGNNNSCNIAIPNKLHLHLNLKRQFREKYTADKHAITVKSFNLQGIIDCTIGRLVKIDNKPQNDPTQNHTIQLINKNWPFCKNPHNTSFVDGRFLRLYFARGTSNDNHHSFRHYNLPECKVFSNWHVLWSF